jgi:hypothetical protein
VKVHLLVNCAVIVILLLCAASQVIVILYLIYFSDTIVDRHANCVVQQVPVFPDLLVDVHVTETVGWKEQCILLPDFPALHVDLFRLLDRGHQAGVLPDYFRNFWNCQHAEKLAEDHQPEIQATVPQVLHFSVESRRDRIIDVDSTVGMNL